VPGSPCPPPRVWGSRSSPSAQHSQELWKALGQLWAVASPLPVPGASSLQGQGSGSCSARQPGGSSRVRAAALEVPLARWALARGLSASGRRLSAGAAGSPWAVASGQAAASGQGRRGCLRAAAEFGSSSTAIRSSAKHRKERFCYNSGTFAPAGTTPRGSADGTHGDGANDSNRTAAFREASTETPARAAEGRAALEPSVPYQPRRRDRPSSLHLPLPSSRPQWRSARGTTAVTPGFHALPSDTSASPAFFTSSLAGISVLNEVKA